MMCNYNPMEIQTGRGIILAIVKNYELTHYQYCSPLSRDYNENQIK